jgi:hypothetical protein
VNYIRRHGRHLVAGAAAFAAAQVVLYLAGPPSGVPNASGWFLDSARGVGVMVIWMTVASAAVGLTWPTPGWWRGCAAFALGAAAALTATLFAIGPGNLFPIVIVIGGGLIAAAALAGAAVAAGFLKIRRTP